jgi:TonB family protein
MALTGQLSDMSLAELIEFFCNQRKTGRLKIDYPRGHSVFFIKEGELVDAKVGALSGSEAVYFSLTLPNAAFDFSPDVQATRRTIHNAWTQVVLEGLRRLDEGLSPTEADAFGAWSPSETELAQMLDQVEHLDSVSQSKGTREKERAARAASQKDEEPAVKESSVKDSSPEPFSMMVESAGAGGGSKKKFVLAGVAAAVVLAGAVAAVPLLNRAPAKTEAAAAANVPAAAAPVEPAPAEAQPAEASGDAAAAPESTDAAATADAARREERDRKERERRRREEAAKKEEAASTLNTAEPAAAAPKPVAPSGPKAVRVTVTYDEAGRVTAASVAGATPGAEAYGSTAVRMARGKRFPAGKPGSTVVTIPVN